MIILPHTYLLPLSFTVYLGCMIEYQKEIKNITNIHVSMFHISSFTVIHEVVKKLVVNEHSLIIKITFLFVLFC